LREALRQDGSGWVDDDLAFVRPWGFDVEELEVPVEIQYGARDVLVPPTHGAWLASHIPHAIVKVDHGAGHLLTPNEHLERLRAFATA
jgi:pimeloyl-ACP methyl ester carboxylesterase